MRDVIEIAAFIALIAALVFIFQGEPDLWDRWHAQAMGVQAASTQGKCP